MGDGARLIPTILAAEQPVFAVLDGAQFDDLPGALLDGDFVHRPLYRDRGDGNPHRLLTAPQLVWLDRDFQSPDRNDTGRSRPTCAAVVDRLIGLVLDRPALVVWMCRDGGDVLFRHLRTISMILLPATSAMDRGRSYERDPQSPKDDRDPPPGDERVLFRHADANVMAQVMPNLILENVLRVLGPAQQIVFSPDEDWNERPMSVGQAPEGAPVPPGPIRLSGDEVARIEDGRLLAARRRRVPYIRETCPEEAQAATREAIEAHLGVSEATGRKLGLVSEGAHCRWAFMMCKTNGRIAESREAIDFIRKGGSPDDRVKLFMEGVIGAMKSRNRAGAT